MARAEGGTGGSCERCGCRVPDGEWERSRAGEPMMGDMLYTVECPHCGAIQRFAVAV